MSLPAISNLPLFITDNSSLLQTTFILRFQFTICSFPAKYHFLNMASLTTHFARRGLELAHGALAGKEDPKIKASPLAILVLVTTCLVFFTLFVTVSGCQTH